MSNSLQISIDSATFHVADYSDADSIEVVQQKKGMLERVLSKLSFDVNQLPPFIVSVIKPEDVGDLSLNGITQTNYWVQKIVLLYEEFPKTNFKFSDEDRLNFYHFKRNFFTWFSHHLPRDLAFEPQACQLEEMPSCEDLQEISALPKALIRIEKAFTTSLRGKEVNVSITSNRRFIDPFDNTSSSLASLLNVDGLEMFNDASCLLNLESPCESAQPLFLAKIQAFQDRIVAHLERRLLIFYASTVAVFDQAKDFPFCEIGIGTTIYQIGKGTADFDPRGKFDAAHSAIIPNIVIKIDLNEMKKKYSNPLIADDGQKLAFEEVKHLLLVDIAKLCAIFEHEIRENPEKIPLLQKLYEKIETLSEISQFKDLFNKTRDSFLEKLFCKSFVPVESYLGQNLASTVCLPKECNEFDGLVEAKLRTTSKDILKVLFKGSVKKQFIMDELLIASKKFNEEFKHVIGSIIDSCQKEIQKSEEDLKNIETLKYIITSLSSDNDQKQKEGLKLFGDQFRFYLGINREAPIEIKNIAINLAQFMEKKIKLEVEQFLSDREKEFIDRIMNFEMIGELEDERIKEIYCYLFNQFKDIFSTSPFSEHIDIELADFLEFIERSSLKNQDNLKHINEKWKTCIELIKIRKLIFWFSEGEFSKENVITLIKQYCQSLASPLNGGQSITDIINSESKKIISNRTSNITLARFFLENLEYADGLAERYFSNLRLEQYLDLHPRFIEQPDISLGKASVASCSRSPYLFSAQDTSVVEILEKSYGSPSGAACIASAELAAESIIKQSLDRQIIQLARQSLLRPFVKLRKESSAFIPDVQFLNVPIFFVLKRIKDSLQYPNGLKLTIDKPQYHGAPLIDENLKKALRKIAPNGSLKLAVDEIVHGIFRV